MLSGYPSLSLDDPQGYISNLVSILIGFDKEDACAGVVAAANACKFPPSRFELRQACEAVAGPRARQRAYAARTAAQLAERDTIAALSPPKQTVEEVRAEMRARGLPMYDRAGQKPHGETAETVREKLGLTPDQWVALPNAPQEPSYWAGKRIPETGT